MPDQRLHRGPHPGDAEAFSAGAQKRLREATDDLCWLLSHGYGSRSALRLVGDRYALIERQRIAVARCACADTARQSRLSRQASLAMAAGACVQLDGFNVLTTVEAALAGGVILVGRDGSFRDMASMHGNYRTVLETITAATLIGETLAQFGIQTVAWYLDRPVSNSGRLNQILDALALEHSWEWQVSLVPDPDVLLSSSEGIVATADSGILDQCGPWLNLARETISRRVAGAWICPLGN